MDLQENRKLLQINAKLLDENDKLQAEKANAIQLIKDARDKLQEYIDKQEKK